MSPAPQAAGRRQQAEKRDRTEEMNRIMEKELRAIPRCGIYTDNVFSHDGSAKKKGITRTGGKRGRFLPCIREIPVKKKRPAAVNPQQAGLNE